LIDFNNVKRFASRINEKVKLSCTFQSYPKPALIWLRNGKEIGSRDFKLKNKYTLIEEAIGEIAYQTSLIIDSITKDDYGQYECEAHNSEGKFSSFVELTKPSKPDPPFHLQVSNVTEKSLELKWLSGFNGGLPVYYRIRYKTKNDDQYHFLEVKHNTNNATLLNLKPNAKHFISIMAINEAGHSKYLKDIEVQLSKGDYFYKLIKILTIYVTNIYNQNLDSTYSSAELSEKDEMPNMMIIAITSSAMVLLIVNAALVAWFVIRRQNKNNSEDDNSNDEVYSKDDNRSVYKVIQLIPLNNCLKLSGCFLIAANNSFAVRCSTESFFDIFS